MLHFVSGCDDISFLRGFKKNVCFQTFVKHSDKLCENQEYALQLFCGDLTAAKTFMLKFICCLYMYKFSWEVGTMLLDLSPLELVDKVRKQTWHKTISLNNTVPTLSAINLHGKRFAYVMSANGNATILYLPTLDPEQCG